MLLDLLHADLTAEDGSNSEVSSLSWIRSSHHVLGIKHLLSELRDTQGTELVASTRSQGSETDHEEVQTGEGDHVDCKFSEIRVQLAGETETGGDTRHDCRDEVVKISVGGSIEFKRTDADIVQGFVVDTERLVRVLNELLRVKKVFLGVYVDGEGGVVRLNDRIGDLWRWNDGECSHHSVGVFFANLADQESTHTSTGTSTERMRYLETLETVTSLGFASNNIQYLINQFGTFSVTNISQSTFLAPYCPLAQLFPAPDCPNTKLSGRKRSPKAPPLTASMVPGSRSTRTARGTYFPPEA